MNAKIELKLCPLTSLQILGRIARYDQKAEDVYTQLYDATQVEQIAQEYSGDYVVGEEGTILCGKEAAPLDLSRRVHFETAFDERDRPLGAKSQRSQSEDSEVCHTCPSPETAILGPLEREICKPYT